MSPDLAETGDSPVNLNAHDREVEYSDFWVQNVGQFGMDSIDARRTFAYQQSLTSLTRVRAQLPMAMEIRTVLQCLCAGRTEKERRRK